jgi:membrane fusion protein (multidrug efflux system)
MRKLFSFTSPLFFLGVTVTAFYIQSCNSSAATSPDGGAFVQPLPVVAISERPATLYEEYSASLEGSKDIEIRPQVDGYIEQIYVDEGARVRKGQLLFRINDRIYREQLNSAKGTLAAATANLASAQINVSKITPLVQNNIVSEVQLKSAQAAYDAAAAQVSQARAMVSNAEINLGYTTIKAPVDGYIGRIPFKTGSLAGVSVAEPLTVISELSSVYAYFSLSENDFLRFKEQYPGNTVEDKVRQMPPVDLVLANGTVFPVKGKVEIVSGQFNNNIGSITFRAKFENRDGQLRSGNTGKVRLPLALTSAFIVPQEATYELQDKTFVFMVGDSNKVSSVPIAPIGRAGNYYLVSKGVKNGDKIVYSGLDRLRDGTVIQPQPISMDSLLQKNPM